ncbi:DUF5412 family protein [Bacillus kwashiorkori]|uniref:DUF5412 family protein n=1 Tax=Bacillus kwashiorkori TaxID=1522318 RepID=UPI001EF12FB7|nr:DUF5412 family protein [Bacillus kwashiorkori]
MGLVVYKNYFFTFNNLKGGFYKGPLISPTKEYTANAYYKVYGGAAGGVIIWENVTYNNDENNVQTIYYSEAKSNFSMEWIDKNTLFIQNEEPRYLNSNRSVRLEIGKEIYHETGLACKSWLVKKIENS